MVRGDDVYLMNFWPMDNLNIVGGGLRYAHRGRPSSSRSQVGMSQPNNPFQRQTDLVPARARLPRRTRSSCSIDRASVLSGAPDRTGRSSAAWSRPRLQGRSSTASSTGSRPVERTSQRTGRLEGLPEDSGFVLGAQLGGYVSSRLAHVRERLLPLRARPRGLRPARASPSAPAPRDHDGSRRSRFRLALSANWEWNESARTSVWACRWARGGRSFTTPIRRSGTEARLSEGAIALRPHACGSARSRARRGLARRGDLPAPDGPFRQRRRAEQRRAHLANGDLARLPGRRLPGDHRSSSTTSRRSGSRRSGSAPSCSTSTRRRGRRLPRLLAQDLERLNPHFGDLATLRAMVDACHAARHQGHRRHRHEPPRAGLLLRHQPERAARRPRSTASGRRSPLGRVTEYDPDYDPRGIQAFTSLGEAGPAPMGFFDMPEIFRVPPGPAVFQQPAGLQPARARDRLQRPEQVVSATSRAASRTSTPRTRVRDELIRVFTTGCSRPTSTATASTRIKHVEHGSGRDFAPRMREPRGRGKTNFLHVRRGLRRRRRAGRQLHAAGRCSTRSSTSRRSSRSSATCS
jgi:hypothetical protein